MKKLLSLFVACALLLAAGCTAEPAQNTPSTSPGQSAATGSYAGEGNGYHGKVKVELTVDKGVMTDLKLVESSESSPVINRAFPLLKERILDAQSPVVDSVSAATYSSFAIKTAVAEAAKQYGADFGAIAMDTVSAAAPTPNEAEVKTQLLIVGGGPAGLAAAIEAKQKGIEDIMVVEKLDILSGNGKFDMNFYDVFNSEAQKANGVEDSVEKFVEDMKDAGNTPERLQVWAEGESQVDAWLRGFGVELNYNYGGRNHMAEADAYAGEEIQDGMEAEITKLGVEVRTGTKGVDLIMEGEKCVGVKVENKAGQYDIKADAVIIATGGFSSNKELLQSYAPGYEALQTSNQMGTTGDFIPVFEKNKMGLERMDNVRVFPYIINPYRDLTSGGSGFLLVNKGGERFISETKEGLELGTAIQAQPESKAYYIYDQRMYEGNYRLRKQVDLGYVTKANTLEELATALNIDSTKLAETMETYNKAIAGEMEDPFRGTETFDKAFATEGPYYGVRVESANHMTKGGVSANERAQVLYEDGTVVPGLYAAGEVTWISGSYSAAVVFGRIAAQSVAADLSK